MDEKIFSITKDRDRARDLFEIAKERLKEIIPSLPKNKPYKLIEEYYEVIKEMLTAIMYIDGYKTLSHKKLIEYFSNKYSLLDEPQVKLIDNLRRLRNDVVYYGKKISESFLINYKEDILKIINRLIKVTEEKLNS